MFGIFGRHGRNAVRAVRSAVLRPAVEGLESRSLLSASLDAACAAADATGGTTAAALTASSTTATPSSSKVAFSAAPTVVQAGLTALAQGTTIPATHVVKVKTLRDGTVTYNTSLAINGKKVKASVDADGSPLAGKLTFGDAPSAVQTALTAQATDGTLSDGQIVTIKSRGATVVYSTSYSAAGKTKVVAANAAGTTVDKKGRELSFGTATTYSAAPAAVQTGLTALAQVTTIGADQSVTVLTLPDASTIYTALLSINGEPTRISVAADGLALEGSIQFSAAPTAVQTGLQTLATGGTIPASQLVQVHTRPGGTSTYSTAVELNDDATIITVDATGAPVTIGPWGGGGPGGGFGGWEHHGPGPGDFGGTRTTVTYADAPAAVKTGLAGLTLGTTIADAQQISVLTKTDGSAVYSTVVAVGGEPARVAVAADGTAIEGLLAYADVPSAAKTGLQALATGGTIAADAVVHLTSRPASPDGTVAATTVYSTTVTIDGRATRIAVDATGVEVEGHGFGRGPRFGFGGPGFGFGGRGGRHGGGHHGWGPGGDGSTDTTGDTSGGTTPL